MLSGKERAEGNCLGTRKGSAGKESLAMIKSGTDLREISSGDNK